MIDIGSPLAAIYSTSTMEHHHFNMAINILQQVSKPQLYFDMAINILQQVCKPQLYFNWRLIFYSRSVNCNYYFKETVNLISS